MPPDSNFVFAALNTTEMKGKCLCIDERAPLDIISTLPETIIEKILCLLPTTQEAAMTSILSREWRYKWTKIPKLEFFLSDVSIAEENQLEEEYSDMACKPFDALLQILLLHQGPIHEFILEIDLDYDYLGLDHIILHLSKNHVVKKLTLDGCDGPSWSDLPMSVFSFHHLTDLYLSYFSIDPQAIFNEFGSLRSLFLNGIDISFKSLLHLLSNCPALKTLYLYIVHLNLGERDSIIIRLFECLPSIEHLTVCATNLEWVVVDSDPQELPNLLVSLKYFCIEYICFADSHGLPFLLILIKCSPNLQKIKLEVDDHSHNCDEDDQHLVKWEEYLDVWLEHLTELEIEWFNNSKAEMEFVKFILARSPKLKKVRIKCTKSREVSMEQRMEMLEVLLQVPCVSQVQIYVSELLL